MSKVGPKIKIKSLPPDFFYKTKADQLELTAQNTSYFEPQEFIQGNEKHWWLDSGVKLKPKTLIIMSCYIKDYTNFQLRRLTTVFKALMQSGFTIYVCQRKAGVYAFIKMTEAHNWQFIRKSNEPSTSKQINQLLLNLSQGITPLAHDEILLLNTDDTENFINDTAFFEINDKPFEMAAASLYIRSNSYLLSYYGRYKQFSRSSNCGQSLEDCKALAERESIDVETLIIAQAKELSLKNELWVLPENILHQLFLDKNNLKRLTFEHIDFSAISSRIFNQITNSHFNELEELDLKFCDISWEILFGILTLFPNLQDLTITNSNISGTFTINVLNERELKLLQLESLIFEVINKGTFLPIEPLEALLKSAINLRKISIKEVSIKNVSDPFSMPNFNNLAQIIFKKNNFDNDLLLKLVSSAPNLEKLYIDRQCSSEQNNGKYEFSCNKLKKLIAFSQANESDNSLDTHLDYQLLNTANNLNLLVVDSLAVPLEELISYLQHRANNNPEVLTKIILMNFEISEELMAALLRFENLQYLRFQSCKVNENIFESIPIESVFINLKYFEISFSSFSQEVIKSLFARMPKLTNLRILSKETVQMPSELFFLISSHLAQLTRLTLSVDLSNVSVTFLNDESVQLNNLIKLDVADFDISPELLYAILLKAKNLKKMLLNKQDFLDDFFEIPTLKPYLKIIKYQYMEEDNVVEEEEVFEKEYQALDADTELNSNQSYLVSRIFYARPELPQPHPLENRLAAFGKIVVKQSILAPKEPPFMLYEDKPLLVHCPQPIWCGSEEIVRDNAWKEQSIYGKEGTRLYASPDPILLSTEWSKLPSKSPQEKLTHLFIKGLQSQDVQLCYDNENNFYMIRLTKDNIQKHKLHYVVDYPSEPLLPQRFHQIVDHFRQRNPGALTITQTNPSGVDYLNALLNQPVGSCRHRVFACKYIIDNKSNNAFNTKIIRNKMHDRLQIKTPAGIHTVNLGGYPAECFIAENYTSEIPENTKSIQERDLNSEFITWPTANKKTKFIDLFKEIGKKILINIPSKNIEDYILMLENECKNKKRPYYYAHEPRDLICSARWIKRNRSNQGELKPGPGGRCHEFLIQNRGKNPILIINYNHFSVEDLVQFNTIIDDERKVDGTIAYEDLTVVGIQDAHRKNAYTGGDFNSRWDEKITIEQSEVLSLTKRLLKRIKPDCGQWSFEINLFNSFHWKQILLGKWILQGKALVFQEGVLKKALRQSLPIHIKNGPWELPDFQIFWQQLFMAEYYVQNGEKIALPKHAQFTKSKGYNWDFLNSCMSKVVQFDTLLDNSVYILHPNNFGHFIGTYEYKMGENQLYSKKGWIEANAGKLMCVQVTRAIAKDQRAQLLALCQQHHVQLQVKEHCEKLNDNVEVIITNDIDACLEPSEHQFDITECSPGDLLSKLTASWEGLSFDFQETISDIWQLLSEGKHVVLKGKFSWLLADSLAAICIPYAFLPSPLNRSSHFGKLTLITDSKESLQFLPYTESVVSEQDKLNKLKKNFGEDLIDKLLENPNILQRSFVQLRAILKAMQTNPLATINSPWQGVQTLNHSDKLVFDLSDLSLQTCEQLDKAREDAFEKMLVEAPFVNMVGKTGVGKTTFIENLDPKRYQVYYGKSSIEAWAKDKREGIIKLWFDDEATLDESNLTLFEGLFDHPPKILVGSHIHELTPLHKAATAFNPVSDGGGRKLPSLIARHGNSLVFEQLKAAQLYHHELKPILQTKFDEKRAEAISRFFLKVYQYVDNIPSESVLISARELKMLALMLVSDSMPDGQKACHIAYSLGKSVLPKERRIAFIRWFQKSFPSYQLKDSVPSFAINDYLVTPSRQEHFELLSDFIKVRGYQQTEAKTANTCYGGLNMLVSEGEPGDGKSFGSIKILQHFGFKERSLEDSYTEEDIYYFIPASMSLIEKQAYLIKAHHEGAVVVMDEINSNSMLEKLLNDLLCGNYEGKRPLRPGFKVIGTQNPIYYAGRRAATPALSRRGLLCHFEPYTPSEMIEILIFKGLEKEQATLLVSQFKKAREYAIKYDKTPLPNFRDLQRMAKKQLDAKEAQLMVERWNDALLDEMKEQEEPYGTVWNEMEKWVEVEDDEEGSLFYAKLLSFSNRSWDPQMVEVGDESPSSKSIKRSQY